jgi:protein-S-isoprenylcysteine O-methyltransferase Ste14
MLVWTIVLFVKIGRGTLAPWDPTEQLVVIGPYSYVRNPMISAVLFMILGAALALNSFWIGAWVVLFFVINHFYFLFSEEPGLTRRFGRQYQEYKRQVPRWIPRWRAYSPEKPRSMKIGGA